MKNILDKIFSLTAFRFMAVLFVVLVVVLIAAPVNETLFGGLTLYAGLVMLTLWAVRKYNKYK